MLPWGGLRLGSPDRCHLGFESGGVQRNMKLRCHQISTRKCGTGGEDDRSLSSQLLVCRLHRRRLSAAQSDQARQGEGTESRQISHGGPSGHGFHQQQELMQQPEIARPGNVQIAGS